MAARRARRLVPTVQRTESDLPTEVITRPDQAATVLRSLIADRAYEVFCVLYLDVRHRIMSYEEFTMGGLAGVRVEIPAIVRNALLAGAVGVVVAHQHPSGDPMPSDDDRQLHEELAERLKYMNIMLLDSLVLGESSAWSLLGDERIRYGGPR